MKYSHKRGDSFSLSGKAAVEVNGENLTDMTGWSIRSQIRQVATGSLIADLDASFLDPAQCLIQIKSDGPTTGWQTGPAEIDIEYTSPSGEVVSTPTFTFKIEKDVTRDA